VLAHLPGLADLFIFFNLGRVLFYFPSFRKMHAARNNLDSHSLLTWSCWIFANFTTGLMFYVQSNELDYKVGLNYANALMCSIGFGLILFKRKKFIGVSESHNHTLSAELEQENRRLKGIIEQMKLESTGQWDTFVPTAFDSNVNHRNRGSHKLQRIAVQTYSGDRRFH
jgi:hypothetical protein